MRILLITVITISIIVVTSLSIMFGGEISITEQKEILNIQLTIASIVFGVMGVWLAVVFPSILKGVFDSGSKPSDKLKTIQELRFLTIPMIASAAIIVYVLIIYLIQPIIVQFPIAHVYVGYLRTMSFTLISLLILVQIWTIAYIFAPGEKLRIKATHYAKKEKRSKGLNSETQSLREDSSN